MGRVSIKGVLLGFVAMMVLDGVSGLVLTTLLGGITSGMSASEIGEATAAMTRSPEFLGWSMILGLLTSVFGGYVAGYIAGKHVYLNALLVSLIGMLVSYPLARDSYPAWYLVAGAILTVPAALVGGRLARK